MFKAYYTKSGGWPTPEPSRKGCTLTLVAPTLPASCSTPTDTGSSYPQFAVPLQPLSARLTSRASCATSTGLERSEDDSILRPPSLNRCFRLTKPATDICNYLGSMSRAKKS